MAESSTPKLTEARFNHSSNLPSLLESLNASILISTYQAGQLVAVGTHAGTIRFSVNQFEQAMGVAVANNRLAVGSKRQVWMLLNVPDLAPQVGEPGTHDACFLTRSSRFTGEVHGHELAFGPVGLWQVTTLFSCLSHISEEFNFIPRWKPPFISALAAEDRCHLNGMATDQGIPRYVTVMAQTNTPGGWRPDKATTGCVLEVPSGNVVAQGFAMPHSPRLHGGRLWVLDSGRGTLAVIDTDTGKWQEVTRFPGYTRGLAFIGSYALVGLSRIRETSVFGGIPIAERREELKCGVGIVDLRTGKQEGHLEFASGVEEVFDVQVLPGIRNPYISGPIPDDSNKTVWVVPPLN
jgi:uncharacterized protein (TIGR03032 family)